VALSLAFEDECDDYTRRVFEAVRKDGALAPSLWVLEVANILAVSVKRKRLNEPDAERFLLLLSAQQIQTVSDNGPSAAELYALALRYGLTAYDAAYLNLVQKSGLPLASKDSALKEAVLMAGLTLF
jgi:predicted nucleic acid-binding protein